MSTACPPKVLVYTANFGAKDEPPYLINKDKADSNIEFLYITDSESAHSMDYTTQVVKRQFSDTVKNARQYKICGTPNIENFDVAIWHDSSILIDCEKLNALIDQSENMLSIFEHDETCTYAEARNALKSKKDHPLRIAFQMLYYGLVLRYPLRIGVLETGIMVMNVNAYRNSKLQQTWWKHVRWMSCRDQLSLPIARWLTGSKVGILEGRGHENPYSEYRGHRKSDFHTQNPFLRINSPFLRKVGLWIIFRIEKYLSTRKKCSKTEG